MKNKQTVDPVQPFVVVAALDSTAEDMGFHATEHAFEGMEGWEGVAAAYEIDDPEQAVRRCPGGGLGVALDKTAYRAMWEPVMHDEHCAEVIKAYKPNFAEARARAFIKMLLGQGVGWDSPDDDA